MNSMDAYDGALLSEISYVNYTEVDILNSDVIKKQLISSGITESLAEDFIVHWRVVDHQPDTESGFSATLFERLDEQKNGTGEYVLGTRGTEQFGRDLVITDGLDIVLDGLALDQIVDLRNYWTKLTTPKGESYEKLELVTLKSETAALKLANVGEYIPFMGQDASSFIECLYKRNDIIIDNYLLSYRVRTVSPVPVDISNGEFVGVLDNPVNASNLISVTGHSLGGHLGVALTRLADGVEAISINGAGFATGLIPGVGGDAELNIRNLFGMLGGASNFDKDRILNLYGDKMPEFVTQNSILGLKQQGAHEPIYIEQPTPIGNLLGHGKEQMTDALAVYSLFYRIVPELRNVPIEDALYQLGQILEVITNVSYISYESVVNALGDIFQAGSTISLPSDRGELYNRIIAIQESDKYRYMEDDDSTVLVSIFDELDNDNEFLLNINRNDDIGVAYRYALTRLNPFVIKGDIDLYSRFEESGQLDIFNEMSRKGTLTEGYVKDRSYFLSTLLNRNLLDTMSVNYGVLNEYYYDVGSDCAFTTINTPTTWSEGSGAVDGADSYQFGDDADNTLQGANQQDRLYGGAGNDILQGNVGDDRLEGGRGIDTYKYHTGDGFDSILDTDGLGIVEVNGTELTGGRIQGNGVWRSDDKKHVYFFEGDLATGGTLVVDGVARIEHFRQGDLGITLEVEVEEPYPVLPDTYHGTEASEWLWLGDVLRTLSPPTDYEESISIYADNGNDAISAALGSDFIQGGQGNDFINAYTGSDSVQAGTGNDVVFTGSGEDTVDGGPGNDVVITSHHRTFATSATLSWGKIVWADIGSRFEVDVRPDVYAGEDSLEFLYTVMTPQSSLDGESINAGWDYTYSPVQGSEMGLITYIHRSSGQTEEFELGFNLFPQEEDTSKNIITGGEGNDFLAGAWGDDVLHGGVGDDRLAGGAGSDSIVGGDHRDILLGQADDDFLYGNAGEDRLFGGAGDDRLYGGDDNDLMFGDSTAVSSDLHGSDILYGEAGDDELQGGGGNDRLDGGADHDRLFGEAGIDKLYGGSGNDELQGDTGEDYLSGGDGRDILVGGEDNDILEGGPGNDVFVMYSGDGQDIITDSAGYDTLQFRNVNIANLALLAMGADLVLTAGSDTVTIKNWTQASPVDAILFSDGTYVPEAAFTTLSNYDNYFDADDGSSGSPLNGTDGKDLFNIRLPEVSVNGGAGSDTYLFSTESTLMEIADSNGDDTLVLSGLFEGELQLNEQGGDLSIGIGQRQVLIRDWDANQIENLILPNGMQLPDSPWQDAINHAPVVTGTITPLNATED